MPLIGHKIIRLHRTQAAHAAILGLALLVMTGPARSDEAAPDKSQYTLFNPTPEDKLRSFSPDRPAKSTGPFTIDAGHWQYELDFFNYTYQRTGPVRTTTWTGPNPTLKAGLTNNIDIEANIAPYVNIATRDSSAGTKSVADGAGDLFVRAKINLWGNDGGKTAAALIPYIKAPTAADGVGNGATEGGVIAALSISLPNDASLTLNSEVDSLQNGSGSGYHANYVNVAGISMPLIKDVTVTGEFWSSINDDPAGVVRQYSLDGAIAWTVKPNVQLDAGVNLGLNSDTPDVQVYAGLAQRF